MDTTARRITQTIEKRGHNWRVATYVNGSLRRETYHAGTRAEAKQTAIDDRQATEREGVA